MYRIDETSGLRRVWRLAAYLLREVRHSEARLIEQQSQQLIGTFQKTLSQIHVLLRDNRRAASWLRKSYRPHFEHFKHDVVAYYKASHLDSENYFGAIKRGISAGKAINAAAVRQRDQPGYDVADFEKQSKSLQAKIWAELDVIYKTGEDILVKAYQQFIKDIWNFIELCAKYLSG